MIIIRLSWPDIEAIGATAVCDMDMPELPATYGQLQRSHQRAFGRFINKSVDFDRNPTKIIENMFSQSNAEVTGAIAMWYMAIPKPPATSGQPRPSHCRVIGQFVDKSAYFDQNPTKIIEKKFPDPGSEATGVLIMPDMGAQDPTRFFPGF